MAHPLATVWVQGPLSKLHTENLTDQNHLKSRSSHFFLHTSWQARVTITSPHFSDAGTRTLLLFLEISSSAASL